MDPQGSPARVVATDVPVLALPASTEASGVSGPLPGRLVVVGVPPSQVPEVADAAARCFLSITLRG